jgi:hypothetical protein
VWALEIRSAERDGPTANACDVYPVGAWFEYRPVYRLYLPSVFVVYASPSSRMLECLLEICHD